MRRAQWVGWSGTLAISAVALVLAFTVLSAESWAHYVGILAAALIGSSGGQLVRGWWRTRTQAMNRQ